jgi:iron complex outermembrane receptor protein
MRSGAWRGGWAGAAAAAAVLLLGSGPGLAQTPDSPERITVTTRAPTRVLETPHAVSVVVGQELRRARPAASLDEALDLIPGLYVQGGRNFAQDSRISIRGYGARATFGIRGIRLYVDGVPSTLPDGQAEVDSLDLAFVERIDVVRSQVSSLYGGGAGGIIAVDTLSPTSEPALRARTLFGTDHLSRYELAATGEAAGTGYALGLARTRSSGYRDHARAEQTTLLAKLQRELDSGWELRAGFSSVWAPEAQDPGGLTAAEVSRDREQAERRSQLQDAGEELDQQKLWLSARRPFETGEFQVSAWALQRDFENKLNINRQVFFEREAWGAAAQYRRQLGALQWSAGVDLDLQLDVRRNHANLLGARGALQLEQSETVRAVGPWTRAELELPGRFWLIAGARYDWVEFVVGDRFVRAIGNADVSDRLHFRQLSPQLALRWGDSEQLQAWGGLVSAFVVPTTTELAPVDSAGGFRSDLDPEHTLGLEVGAKGLLLQRRLGYDLTLFDLRVDDVAVPAQTPSGDDIFRDAGRVRRRGVELGVSALLHPWLSLRLGYTFADFRYKDFDTPGASFDGKREPNFPQQQLAGELRLDHPSGAFGVLAVRHFSDIEVDDANSAESDGATLADIRVGWDIQRRGLTIQPFAGLRNFTRARYDQTLRPNAVGGRYYEPAPLMEVYGGVELRFGRN